MPSRRRKKKGAPCYWCGGPSCGQEHVPPDALFPDGHRKNLLTVPACRDHNFGLKRYDDTIKPVLLVGGANPLAFRIWNAAFDERLTQTKTAQDFRRQVRLLKGPPNPELAVFPDPELLGGFATKVLRAICYHHTDEPSGKLNLLWTWDVERRVEREKPVLLSLFERGRQFFQPGECYNPDVFTYRFLDALAVEEAPIFMVWGCFYGGFQLLGRLTEPDG